MKQQDQVNSGDIHPKVVQAVRLRRKRKVKKMGFQFFEKDRRKKGKQRPYHYLYLCDTVIHTDLIYRTSALRILSKNIYNCYKFPKEKGERTGTEKGRQGKYKYLQYLKKLMATVEISLPQPFHYAKFRYNFLKVMLTKLAQNESNLPCQNALKFMYGNVKIKKIFRGLYPWTPA